MSGFVDLGESVDIGHIYIYIYHSYAVYHCLSLFSWFLVPANPRNLAKPCENPSCHHLHHGVPKTPIPPQDTLLNKEKEKRSIRFEDLPRCPGNLQVPGSPVLSIRSFEVQRLDSATRTGHPEGLLPPDRSPATRWQSRSPPPVDRVKLWVTRRMNLCLPKRSWALIWRGLGSQIPRF